MTRHFGPLPGVPEGTTFVNRQELRDAKVHLPLQAGISFSASEGADSVVLSGGYADDEDHGEVILYTGEGGRDPLTGKQIRDQQLVRGHLALTVNQREGLPVRVVRGGRHRLGKAVEAAPQGRYEYAGLYRVTDHWREQGRDGFLIWRFRLEKLGSGESQDVGAHAAVQADPLPPRRTSLIQRIVRSTAAAREVKVLYGFCCQVCGSRLDTPAGPYAEAAHIRPLGSPHHGPDHAGNILCLCPNHHVLFDFGAFAVADDHSLIGLPGRLTVHPSHALDPVHLRHHRLRFSPVG